MRGALLLAVSLVLGTLSLAPIAQAEELVPSVVGPEPTGCRPYCMAVPDAPTPDVTDDDLLSELVGECRPLCAALPGAPLPEGAEHTISPDPGNGCRPHC